MSVEYGLIGEKLGHSFSKLIHERLADYTYELRPLPKQELPSFMQAKQFRAINVTIPYKQDVIPYCDELDNAAKAIGAVNTIVNRDGRLIGYNTDFAGFLYNLQVHGISMQGKKVLICGSGGTCKTVTAVAKQQGAREIIVAGRMQRPGVISYEQCVMHTDVEVVVNASPCGMYPECDAAPLDLTVFSQCSAVIDAIYNPLKTRLLQQAEALGMQAVNGLQMLVAQAKFAAEHFLLRPLPDEVIGQITVALLKQLTNLVLIGMPSSGKTLTGQALSRYIDKEFVDTDAVIEARAGMPIKEIFAQHGEAYFRELEQQVIAELAQKNGLIIATGGGAVKNPQNMKRLKQNGVVVFIDRDLQHLLVTDDRPLSSSAEAVEQLYRERYPLYRSYGDLWIANNYPMEISQQELDELMRTILEGYDEILRHQWA